MKLYNFISTIAISATLASCQHEQASNHTIHYDGYIDERPLIPDWLKGRGYLLLDIMPNGNDSVVINKELLPLGELEHTVDGTWALIADDQYRGFVQVHISSEISFNTFDKIMDILENSKQRQQAILARSLFDSDFNSLTKEQLWEITSKVVLNVTEVPDSAFE